MFHELGPLASQINQYVKLDYYCNKHLEIDSYFYLQSGPALSNFLFVGHRTERRNHTRLRGFFVVFLGFYLLLEACSKNAI